MSDTAQSAKEREAPRRAFLSSAFVSLSSVVGATLAGCQGERPSNLTDAEEAELQSLRKVDPKWIGYVEVGRIETGLQSPQGIAVGPDGLVWVAGDAAVRAYSEGGKLQAEVKLTSEPTCVAVDRAGQLYVGLTDRVRTFSKEGAGLAEWPPMGDRAHITALCPDGDHVWVANAGDRVVARATVAGLVDLEIGRKDPDKNYGGLVLPSPHLDVAVTPQGSVLVSNPGVHQVETWTRNGKRVSGWGVSSDKLDGFCGCCNPTDIALLPDGKLATSEKGIPRVKVYSVDGKFDTVVAGPDSFPPNTLTLDLAATPSGDVLVLDARASAVRIFRRRA